MLPIIREFNPDMILVSAGFNATEGHPNTLGGYSVTPACKSTMTAYCTVSLLLLCRLWASHSYADECRKRQGGNGIRGRVSNIYDVKNALFYRWYSFVLAMSFVHFVPHQNLVSELYWAMRYVCCLFNCMVAIIIYSHL